MAELVAAEPERKYVVTIRFQFETERHADCAHRSLDVDKELKPHLVSRSSRTEGSTVVVTFKGDCPKSLRVSVGGFFELADVAAQAIRTFG